MKSKLYVTLFVMGLGQLCYAQNYKNEIALVSENDAYVDITSDRYYTNGFFVKFHHALDQDRLKSGRSKEIIGFEVGQKIYNPFYSFAPDPTTHDRPFSAYLYGEANFTRFYNNHQSISVSGQLGIAGKNAMGETFQKAFHKLVGQNKIEGWEYALNSEPKLNFAGNYNRRLFATNDGFFDLTGGASAALGNVITKAGVGAMFRLGKFNDMDGSAAFNSLVSSREANAAKRKYELFLSVAPQVYAVAYDSSLQGGLFIKDKGPITFEPKRVVFNTQVALTFAIARWTASYAATFTTNEVKNSASGYRYAYYSLAYRFSKS